MTGPTTGWQRRGAHCACGAHLDDTDVTCPACGHDTGDARPVDVIAIVTTGRDGNTRLHTIQTTGRTSATSTTLTAAQARAVARPWATPQGAER